MRKKKAAIELSMGTIVIVVLSMSMLILGLTLISRIWKGTTDSVDTINEQVKKKISNLFAEEGAETAISLGAQQTATVRQGTQNFGVLFAFSPKDPTYLSNDKCKYAVEVEWLSRPGNCGASVSKDLIKNWILTPGVEGTPLAKFDRIEGNVGYALMKASIPETIMPCRQRFFVNVYCSDNPAGANTVYARNNFDLEIVKKGIFG